MDTPVIERSISLPKDHDDRLRALAQRQRLTEDQVVTKALDILFSLVDVVGAGDDRHATTVLSEESLTRVWENDEDATYDNWRETFGVPAR